VYCAWAPRVAYYYYLLSDKYSNCWYVRIKVVAGTFLLLITIFFCTQIEIIAGLVCNNPSLEADLKKNTDVEAAPPSTLRVCALCATF
jgi:hypothetical protein